MNQMGLTPELKALEAEIFKHRKVRRIGLIREAWAAYLDALEEPKLSTWEKFWAVVGRSSQAGRFNQGGILNLAEYEYYRTENGLMGLLRKKQGCK